jgi:hypothetical protein
MTAVASPLGRLFEVPACAAYLDITEAQLRRHIQARRIRILRAGRKVQIYETWAEEFRQTFTVEPAATSRGSVPDEAPTPQRVREMMPARRQMRVVSRVHRLG